MPKSALKTVSSKRSAVESAPASKAKVPVEYAAALIPTKQQEIEVRRELARTPTRAELLEEKQTRAMEVETVINMNAFDKHAEVYTDEDSVRTRLESLGYKAVSNNGAGGVTFHIPRSVVLFGDKTRMTRSGKLKRVSGMSEENRKAAGLRLQTARAEKFGLTLEQYKSLRLRPGQVPDAKAIKQAKKGNV